MRRLSAYERCAIYTICRLAMTITVTIMKPGEFKMISCRNEWDSDMKYRQRLAAETHSASYEQARRLPLVTEADISIIEDRYRPARPAVTLGGSRRRRGAPWRTAGEIIDKLALTSWN